MVDAAKLLGVDVMTGHWEFTYGAARVKEIVDKRLSPVASISSRRTSARPTSAIRCSRPTSSSGSTASPVAIVGQAFPYTPIANPRYFVPEWTFGIQEEGLQKAVDEARAQGCAGGRAVVAQRHGRRPQARVARDGHRCDPRRAHA